MLLAESMAPWRGGELRLRERGGMFARVRYRVCNRGVTTVAKRGLARAVEGTATRGMHRTREAFPKDVMRDGFSVLYTG